MIVGRDLELSARRALQGRSAARAVLPFIELVKERLDVLHLEGRMDYRMARLMSMQVYHVPLGPRPREALDHACRDLNDNAPTSRHSRGDGRKVPGPRLRQRVGALRLRRSLRAAAGADRLIAIANAFHTVVLADIPRLAPERRDTVKRFATLIDILYERRIKLRLLGGGGAPGDSTPKGQRLRFPAAPPRE